MRRKPSAKVEASDELRRRAGELRAAGYDYARIAQTLGITPIRARDFVRQLEVAERKRKAGPPPLSRRAKLCLVHGRHGRVVSRLLTQRFLRVSEIAMCYTWQELLAEDGLELETAREIRQWLKAQGLSFRAAVSNEPASLKQAALQPLDTTAMPLVDVATLVS